jgi:hypothetical protein
MLASVVVMAAEPLAVALAAGTAAAAGAGHRVERG